MASVPQFIFPQTFAIFLPQRQGGRIATRSVVYCAEFELVLMMTVPGSIEVSSGMILTQVLAFVAAC